MKSFFATAFVLASALVARADDNSTAIVQAIVQNATADSINLQAIPNLDLNSILSNIGDTIATAPDAPPSRRWLGARTVFTNLTDVHAHCVPDWYRAIVPTTGGNPTPQWNISGHLGFMASEGISRAVLAFSSPGANVYKGNQVATIALARLINEQTAAYVRAYPTKFAFYAVVPLPYTQAAIAEANYALDVLGAAGIALYSNFEGHYLGDASFTPFFKAMNARGAGQLIYVHPTTPYIQVNGQWVEANPTVYPTGNIEFYFETARMLEDLAITQTILNFTNIDYIIPHVGGAFPSVADRLLKSFPATYAQTMAALQSRFFWDSAGPTYTHQVAGLLAYGVTSNQLLFGTDYPYAPGFTQGPSLLALENSPYVNDAQRTAIFTTNAQNLFGKRLP